MAQIKTADMPAYVPNTQAVGGKSKAEEGAGATAGVPETTAPQDDFQLTRLSSVLTALKIGASVMRSQVSQLMGAVRTGSYQVDAMAVSRSIVGDSLAQS
jgi:hypothetical protein